MNGMEKLREYADATKWGGECRILHAHHGDFAGDCSERECGECRAAYLRAIADAIEDDRAERPKGLDADGAEIRVGDTVYEADGSGHAFKVVGIRIGDGSVFGQTVVTCDVGDGTSEHFLPINLTHEQPDTWARIERDAKMPPRDYLAKFGIERKPNHTTDQQKEDLVRRCKALAEREAR